MTGWRITAYIGVGAIINVAIAWGCAVWVDDLTLPAPGTAAKTTWKQYSDAAEDYLEFSSTTASKCGFDMMILTAGLRKDRQYYVSSHLVVRAGFPLRCLEADGTLSRSPRLLPAISIDRPLDLGVGILACRSLPLRPKLVAFVVNTICYASIAVLCAMLMCLMQQCMRLKRGACAFCGYPLRGSELCSECGHSIIRMKAP